MEEGDTDWERAHFRVERNGVRERYLDLERAHLTVGMVWGREMPTGRERT